MAKEKYEVKLGEVFTRLTVTVLKSGYRNSTWYHTARCECGRIKEIAHSNLVLGKSKSCGCLSREITSKRAATHGMSGSAEYQTWNRMWSRCTNPIVDRYPNYGGRGISVCDRWEKFQNFFEDMGRRPSPKHSIGRIDNDGNYEPNNCRWETPEQQASNTSNNRHVDFDGRKMTISACERHLGIPPGTLTQRLALGIKPPELFAIHDLRPKPITVDGVTHGTVEWMRIAGIPISSFYHHQRKGLSPEDIVRLYLRKKEKS